MAKIKKQSESELLQGFLAMHAPKEYLDHFELSKINNKTDFYELVLHEKEELLPPEIKELNVVLDGFCNPISIMTHVFSLKPVFLVVYRRRWKVAGTDKHYSNEYELHQKGLKLTPHYVAFLKEYSRITGCKY